MRTTQVEEHAVTEEELAGHVRKGYIASFDTHAALSEFVGGEPILNKLGLVLKVRNGKTKARMILDTKESGIKHVTSPSQRVILPKLLGAVLLMLFLIALSTGAAGSISSFVLDFSDPFWQIPIGDGELRCF